MGWRRRERNYIMPCRRRTSETGRVVTLPSWLLRYLIILKINTSPEATRSLCKEARNSEPTWGFSRIYSCRSRSVETHLLKTFRQQLELSTFNIGFIPFDHCGLFFRFWSFQLNRLLLSGIVARAHIMWESSRRQTSHFAAMILFCLSSRISFSLVWLP